nr:hypothetical protein CFP56_71276 [Quercus suber]
MIGENMLFEWCGALSLRFACRVWYIKCLGSRSRAHARFLINLDPYLPTLSLALYHSRLSLDQALFQSPQAASRSLSTTRKSSIVKAVNFAADAALLRDCFRSSTISATAAETYFNLHHQNSGTPKALALQIASSARITNSLVEIRPTMRFSTLAIFTTAAAVRGAVAQDAAEPYTVVGDITSAQTTFTTTRTVYRVEHTVTATRSHSWSSATASFWATSSSLSSSSSSAWSTTSASSVSVPATSAAWPSSYANSTTSQSSIASSGLLPSASSIVPVSGATSLSANALSFAAVAGIIGLTLI